MVELECSQDIPHYNPMWAIFCHGSDLIWPKCSLTPTQIVLQIEFDFIGLLISEIFMLESVYGRTDGRQLESHPVISPEAFSSGELKICTTSVFN